MRLLRKAGKEDGHLGKGLLIRSIALLMEIKLPLSVTNIIRKLEKHGHEAYAVGGCVRDCFLGKVPKDWDITTSARPEEVKEIFPKTIDTGIQHGTVTVMIDHVGYEVTTYRLDGVYKDGRHPEQVTFTPSLLEDLKRRDFTINAMAYNPSTGLVDAFDGQKDLADGLIRCVGDPERRFSEDALRMMRAIRFAARFDFRIEEETYRAIRDLAPTLSKVSMERIRDEFEKTITSDHPERIRDFYETGLLSVFLPEWKAMEETEQHTVHHCYNVAGHTIEVMRNIPGKDYLRLAALLHDVDKPACERIDQAGVSHFDGHPAMGAVDAGKILKRLRYDNETIKKVVNLIRWHDERPQLKDKKIRLLISRVTKEAFPDLLLLKRADTLGQSTYKREEKLAYIDRLEEAFHQILEREDPLSVKDLKVTGKDLLELGIPQGKAVGQVLRELLNLVLGDPTLNEREKLLEIAARWMEKDTSF
jgi:tRNA nucleotidyltransferase (CCA-adding enzyme)